MKKGMYKLLVSLYCFILCMSFFSVPVYADEDIEFYYPDENSYMAYQYFINHGYSNLLLSSSGTNTVTYNVNLTNDLDADQTYNGSISGQEHTTGTVGTNGSATLGSRYMTCTTNNSVSGTQTYSCYFSSSSYSVNNSQSINMQMNVNEYNSVNNSLDIGTVAIDGTTKGTITSSSVPFSNKLYEKMPFLNGTYTHNSTYNANDFFVINSQYEHILAFIYQGSYHSSYKAYGNNNNQYTVNVTASNFGNGWRMLIYSIKAVDQSLNLTFDIDWLDSERVIPIYNGKINFMTDRIRQMCGIDTDTVTQLKSLNDIFQNGTVASRTVENRANNRNTTLNNEITNFDTLESNSVNDMNSKLSTLNLTSDILSNSKFLTSARWVKTQFDRMTVSTPIGSVLSFSLILGMTLIFLGKIK